MLNVIKMDLYRMFRTKSLYVVWVIATVIMFGTTYILRTDSGEEFDAHAVEVAGDVRALGIQVMIPPNSDGNITVQNIFYGNAQSKFYALFLAIFTVIFVLGDTKSGYIKNIGGQMRDRGLLVIAKAVSLFIYTFLMMVGMILIQMIVNRLMLGYLEIGNIKELFLYAGIQLVLHYALLVICMTVAVILKSSTAAMVIAVCLCMDMMVILYSAVDRVLAKMGVEDFSLYRYSVTGRIAMLSQNPAGKECFPAVMVAAAFVAVCIVVCVVVFRKRDI